MTLSLTAAGAGATNKTAGAGISVTVSVTAGQLIVVCLAMDNSAATGGAPTVTLSDGDLNSYLGSTQANRTPGASSNDGVSILLRYAIAQATNATLTVSAAFSVSTQAKCMWVHVLDRDTSQAISGAFGEISTGADSTPSIAVTPAASGTALITVLGVESSTQPGINDTDTLEGSWSTVQKLNTTGGSAASNISLATQVKITSGVSTQTWNAAGTQSGDFAGGVLPLREVPVTRHQRFYRRGRTASIQKSVR